MGVLVVGTDFSTRSDRALRRAVLLARQHGFELRLVHVIDDDQPERLISAERRVAWLLLAELEQSVREIDGVACRSELRLGRAAEQIVAAAHEAGAVAIVAGPHRHAGLGDAFGGTTAGRVVRRSAVPLLAANAVPVGPYRRLLLPTDLGDASRLAAEAVRKLPFGAGTTVTFLYVYAPEAREMIGFSLVPGEERDAYLLERARHARAELAAFAAASGWEEARLRVHASKGSVPVDILEVASADGFDLLVLARSNKGVIGHTILGSVTEGLLQAGRCDVLVVPDGIATQS